MQQPGPMYPVMPSFPPTSITTEQIQKYLDENKKLILAILDNQNLGKLAECAQYQAQLQKNLMYLAAIADAQPQTAAIPPQMSPHPATQQGGFYMQHHPPQMGQQFPSRPVFSNPHSMQDIQHHLQATQSLRPVGSTQLKDAKSNAGNKQQDKPDGGAVATSDGQGQGQGNSNAVAHGEEPK